MPPAVAPRVRRAWLDLQTDKLMGMDVQNPQETVGLLHKVPPMLTWRPLPHVGRA